MSLLILGIHYQSASIEIREQFAFVGNSACEMSCGLVKEGWVAEALILSTCHRTELYCYRPEEISLDIQGAILDRLMGAGTLKRKSLMPFFYTHRDLTAVIHTMRVASGLESMVLGEAEIFGQMKRAYVEALQAGSLGKILNRLFQTTFSVVKTVRNKTNIGAHPVSIGFAAAKLIECKFRCSLTKPLPLKDARVLLMGAGEIIRLTALHLQKLGVSRWWIANRTTTSAEMLGERLKATVIPWGSLREHLCHVDIVVTATSSQQPIIKKPWIDHALKYNHSLFILDLAVPRDVEPNIAHLEEISLYTVDDLQEMVEENRNIRKENAIKAEAMIQIEAEIFMASLNGDPESSLIRELRDKAEQLRDEACRLASKKLKAGQSPEDVLQRMALSLTNQWLHDPVKQIRLACRERDKTKLEFIRELLGLTEYAE